MKLFPFVDQWIISALSSMDKGSFSHKEKILFFKELSYLLKGGVGVAESLQVLIDTTDNFALKDISHRILEYLVAGKSLSYALNRLPEYFDEGDFALVKSGEFSGTLPVVLTSLANEYSYLQDIKSQYVSALMYPLLLLCVAFVAVISLFVFVLPNVFSLADSFSNIPLPFMTALLKNFSTFLSVHWQGILWGIGGVVFSCLLFFSTETGQKFGFRTLLNIPLLGKLTKRYYVVRFCRYFHLMLSSKMNYVDIFTLLRDILGISLYKEMVEQVLSGLKRGENIYDHIKAFPDLLPPDVPAMIKVGEKTARLEESLQNILQMYDTELRGIIARVSKIIEPIMLIFIGGIVVVIAFAVFGLIMQIMDGAGM